MNFEAIRIKKCDEDIEKADKQIEDKKREMQKDNDMFTGRALVTFETENMRDEVLKNNGHTWNDRYTAYRNEGRADSL